MKLLYWLLAIVVLAGLTIRLFFWQGTLFVDIKPADSRLTIGNKAYPQGKIKLNPGSYHIAIAKDGYIPYAKDIKIRPGLLGQLAVDLRPLPEPKLLDEGILQINTDGQTLFYLGNGGKTIYKYENGQSASGRTSLTPDNLTDIKQVIWSPDFQLALLLRSKDAGLYDFKRYDLINQVYTSFGKDIKALAWSPEGDRIAYIYSPLRQLADGEVSLIKAEPGNQNMERVADLRSFNLENPGLEWSKDGKYILIVGKDVLLFDSSNRTTSQLTQTGKITSATFTPGNQQIIYATLSPDPTKSISTTLSTMGLDGKNKTNLPLRAQPSTAWFKDSQKFLAWTDEGLLAFDLSNQTKTKYTYRGKIEPAALVLGKDEKSVFYLEAGKLYELGLERAEY